MTYNFDKEFAEIAGMIADTSWDDPAAAREEYETRVKNLSPNIDTSGLNIRDISIPTFGDGPEFILRIYSPKNIQKPRAGLLQIHGGGFVIGSLETEHPSAVRNALKLGAVVVSVDYRLAPENPYPAGLHDCYAALKWMHDNAEELKIDPARIAVMGTSAGGGLAAGLNLMVRDRKRAGFDEPNICFQCLIIPELDDRLQTPSMQKFIDTPIWNLAKAKQSWSYYLGELERGGDHVPNTAAPAREEDLSDLPPTYINTMEFDPLRDEGVLYGLKLMQAGVQVELHAYPGTFHGSTMFKAEVSKRQIDETTKVLSKALA